MECWPRLARWKAICHFSELGLTIIGEIGGGVAELLFDGEVNAPDFPTGLDWINADRPISLRDLRGKIVLLDFWTYC